MGKISSWAALLLLTVVMAGCLDYEEEMWLESDLSGRIAMKISAPEEIMTTGQALGGELSEANVRAQVEQIPGTVFEKFEVVRKDGKVVANLGFRFASVTELTAPQRGAADASLRSLFGTFRVTRESGKVILERTLNTLPQGRSSELGADLLAKALGGLLLSQNHLRYTLHTPAGVVASNGAGGRNASPVVEWKFSLAQALREAPRMRVEWRAASPWLWSVIGGVAVIAAGALVWVLARRRRGEAVPY